MNNLLLRKLDQTIEAMNHTMLVIINIQNNQIQDLNDGIQMIQGNKQDFKK